MDYAVLSMPTLRLIAWNCHHGSIAARLEELASCAPAVVFLQECSPIVEPASPSACVTRRVNVRKAIALGSLGTAYEVRRLRARRNRGQAVVAAAVSGPVSFTALGSWSRGPRYADDVMRTLEAYERLLRSGPAVVMGDLNSGTNLARDVTAPSKGHARIVSALADLGLVSAYHAFHQIDHGREHHATYRHQRNPSKPWHIDFCFVPKGWKVVDVEVLDGKAWAARSDHLPLKVDVQVVQ
jgi:endonuclease/exonuclease/phosphatase (EEP) superfamily protein YafD